jgi:hypothetical protein
MQNFWGGYGCWGSTRKTEEIPEYGNVYTIHKFINMCRLRGFINSDGIGFYATKDRMFRDQILPSDVVKGNNVKNYPYIVWLNN